MTEKRFKEIISIETIVDNKTSLHYKPVMLTNDFLDLINELADENEQLKDALNQRTEQCDKYYEENEKLKKGMIEIVDRYIWNVEHNPPSSTRTYLKVKGALDNVREGLRDLLEDLE